MAFGIAFPDCACYDDDLIFWKSGKKLRFATLVVNEYGESRVFPLLIHHLSLEKCLKTCIFGVDFADRKSRLEIEQDAGVGDRQLSKSLHSLAEFRVRTSRATLKSKDYV